MEILGIPIFCPNCEGAEMEHKQHNETHLYICPECPNVVFEYINGKDIENLKEYFDNQR